MEKFLARKRGFTLIELIIVIAIIAIIVAAVFVAMDPAKRLNASRNSRRVQDVTAIAQAIALYITDGNTSPVDAVTATWQMIGTGGVGGCGDAATDAICDSTAENGMDGASIVNDCLALGVLVPNYLPAVPISAKSGTETGTPTAVITGYMVNQNGGSLTVQSCTTEGEGAGGTGNGPALSVTR